VSETTFVIPACFWLKSSYTQQFGVTWAWIPANRLDPEGVKRENENAAGGQTVFQEAIFGVNLLRDSLVVIPAIF
jgi:hypothetical protein